MTNRSRSTAFLVAFAALSLLGHALVNHRYGIHRDELPVLDDALHLAWGYVVYPPVTPFVARIALILFGPSVAGLRLFSTLAFCLVIVLTGLMARTLGAGRWGQLLAAAAVATAGLPLHNSGLFQYVTFDYLAWVLTAYFVLRLLHSKDARWWLAVGAAIAFGMLSKYTIGVFILGLALGVFLTPARKYLRSRWLWLGALLSFVLFLPHLYWEWRHHFVSVDALAHIHARDVELGRADHFLIEQLLVGSNPLTAPLWMAGLWFYCCARRGQPYRVLGWMYFVPLLLLFLINARSYYLAPAYPMLLAAGSVWWSEQVGAFPARWRRIAAAGTVFLLAAGGVVTVRLLMPVATINSALWQKQSKVIGDFPDEIGWLDLVAEVAAIYHAQPIDRGRVAILAGNYGETGAINLYGSSYGLPRAISGVNSYWARGYGEPPPETVVLVGFSRQRAERYFREVTLAGHITNSYGVKNEETEVHPDIFVVRGPRKPWPELWLELQGYG